MELCPYFSTFSGSNPEVAPCNADCSSVSQAPMPYEKEKGVGSLFHALRHSLSDDITPFYLNISMNANEEDRTVLPHGKI